MNDRGGGGEGEGGGRAVDRTCSQSCPNLHKVRKTRDRCVQATEGWHGVKGSGGWGGGGWMEMVGAGGLCMGSVVRPSVLKGGLRWELEALEGILLLKSNEYVWSSFHSKDGPPGN